MSLRARITLAAAAAVAAVAVVLGAIGYFPTRAELTGQIRQELQGLVTTNQGDHRDHGQPNGQGPPGCQATPDQLDQTARLGGATGYFQSVCSDGTVVADQGGTPQLPVTAAVRKIAASGSGSLYFSATVSGTHVEILAVGDAADEKAIEVALPLTSVDTVLRRLLVIFLITLGVGILLAGLVGLLIARAALAPITRFSRRTEQVAAELSKPGRLEESGAQELRRLAVSFNRTLDALERSVEAQRHLIADASHELRTPMAALRSNIQIFLDADQLPSEERAELQHAIIDELDELTQLVADVLDLARGTTPSDHVELIDLDELVRDAVARAGRRVDSPRFDVELEPTSITNETERVARAVRNVVDNACKWSPTGGTVEITLRSGQLAVRDHGPGFDPDDLEHVFDRFYRSARARGTPGSGLGLAIVKQAAEAQGGRAEAANAADGGAILRVSFTP